MTKVLAWYGATMMVRLRGKTSSDYLAKAVL